MSEHNAVVGVYNSHPEAEAAVKALQRSGFDMQKLSIVGKDYHTEEHVIGYDNAGDRGFQGMPCVLPHSPTNRARSAELAAAIRQ